MADGSILISKDSKEIRVDAPITSSGDYDAWLFKDPASGSFIASQSSSSGQGFVKTFIRKISCDGRVEVTRDVCLADIRAVVGTPIGVLYYDQTGLIEFSSGRTLHNAAGYPLVAMVSAIDEPAKIIGLRSDNSLLNHNVMKQASDRT